MALDIGDVRKFQSQMNSSRSYDFAINDPANLLWIELHLRKDKIIYGKIMGNGGVRRYFARLIVL